jgi:ACS family tartrate transporter-like MFS transporter
MLSMFVQVRVGAPTFLAVSLVAWGIFASAFAAVQGVAAFYILRILLGVAESGTFPGKGALVTWAHREDSLPSL